MNEGNQHNKLNIPEGYFRDFQQRLTERLEEDTSFLPKDDGFTVPKGYFDNLENRILEKTVSKPSGVIRWFPKKEYYYIAAVAAVFLLLFNLGIFDKKNGFDTLAEDEIEAYVQAQSSDISALDIASVFEDIDLSEISFSDQTLDQEAMIDYLSENLNSYDEIQ